MNVDDAISISDDEDREQYVDRRSVLEPAIRNVVGALGGYEGGEYMPGDECYGCLKDLKKFWRKDDTDDERTVARIFWETRLLPNDLIPILLTTAGRGDLEDKRAIACADLMTAMTWPIDMAEELKELDDELDKGTDYTQLLFSHLNYKAVLLKPGVMQALFGIMLPCLAKDLKERKERDVQIVNVILYLIRNLAFIKDLPPNMHASADQAEYSSLQSQLILMLSNTNTLDLLLAIASNASTDAMFNGWNTLVLEIFYLLFRGVKPSSLAMNQAKQPAQNLQRLLAVEDQRKRGYSRNAASRHSRFGTTISVQLNPKKRQPPKPADEVGANTDETQSAGSSQAYVLHRQKAIHGEAGSILDMASSKRHKAQKGKKIDELARDDNFSLEAKLALQNLARSFIESCFNPFFSSLLKDIKAERPKVTEKDNLRLLYLTKWFLDFFVCTKTKELSSWSFGLIAEITERSWIVWILRRMREAVEDKPKLWTELQAGVECLTQLVLVIDLMSSSPSDSSVVETADILQQQIIYNGEVLDIAFESVRTYKQGTQSLAYLDSSVHLAHALLRMLEKWGKKRGGEMYVRKKAKAKRRKGKGQSAEGDDVPDEEEEAPQSEEEIIHETMFTFEVFEAKFAHPDVTQTLLSYLSRYKEFTSSESMKRIVSLLHRQAVRAKAEGLFFKVSTLDLFKSILAEEKSLPREQPYKDLIALINFILRKFFKAVAEEPFLVVEAFFPKNRGQWKQFSSWEPEEKVEKALIEDTQFPPDVQVKKGYTWSEQLGIAIACLVDSDHTALVRWVQTTLLQVIHQRTRIIEDTDGSSSQAVNSDDDGMEDDPEAPSKLQGPSKEALEKMTDFLIPYISDEQADAATKNPHLKLVFRLVKFAILDEDSDELEWYVPAAILPAEMQRNYNVIAQFLETPLDLGGKKAEQLLSKKRRRRRRREPSPDSEDDGDQLPKKKKEKKKKEKQQYKSAQFIEDSDAEYGDMTAFFEKEKALRAKTALAAAESGKPTQMKSVGTKKRRKDGEKGAGKRKRKRGEEVEKVDSASEPEKVDSSDSEKSEDAVDVFGSPKAATSTANTSPREPSEAAPQPRPRPRPRPKPQIANATTVPVDSHSQDAEPVLMEDRLVGDSLDMNESALITKKKLIVISDDDD